MFVVFLQRKRAKRFYMHNDFDKNKNIHISPHNMDFACALNTCAGCTEYIICIPLKTYTRSKPYIEMFLINLNYLRSLIMHFVIPFICC